MSATASASTSEPAALAAVLELTDDVQRAIDAGDWQRAAELEERRRRQLESILTALAAADLAAGAPARAALAALENRGYQLIGAAHHHRRRLLREAATVTTGAAAVDAYGRTARAAAP